MSRGFTAGLGQEVPSTDRCPQRSVEGDILSKTSSEYLLSFSICKKPCVYPLFFFTCIYAHCIQMALALKFTSASCVRSYMMSRDDSIHKHMHAFVFIALFNVEVDSFTKHLELLC